MFLTLNEYLNGAQKMLIKHGYSCLHHDEDAISYVASCMMNADHTWNGKSSRDTWRYNQAKFAILKLQTKYRKKPKHKSLHTQVCNKGNREIYLYEVLVSDEDEKRNTKEKFQQILGIAKKRLNRRQYNILLLYYNEHMTLQEIGSKLSISRERVRQILEFALNKIRNEC